VTAWWRLVAAREVTTRSRDKSFLVSTLVLLVLVVGGIVVGSFVAGRPAAYDVAVTDPADESAARAAVATGALSQLTLAANAERAGTSLAALTRGSTLTEDVTEDGPVSSDAAAAAGFVMALLFFTAAIGFGLAIVQSVVVEKENRIVEILVAAVPTRALLWGKITGNSLLALAQLLVVAAGSVLALAVVGDAGSLPSIGVAGVWFVAFFVVGFVALASVWSVAGALATRQEDLQATSVPGQVLLLVPYLVAVTGNERAIEIASWVPIASSMTMPAQLLAGQASWWQGAVSLALAAVSAALLVRLGARLYERTLLQTSRRTSYRELLAMRG